jgi:hypothetical protein
MISHKRVEALLLWATMDDLQDTWIAAEPDKARSDRRTDANQIDVSLIDNYAYCE